MSENVKTEKSAAPKLDAFAGGGTKQTSSIQLIITIFVLSLATKIFMLPVYLIHAAGRDGYLVLTAIVGLDLVSLALMLVAVALAKTDMFTLTERLFGKVGAKITVTLIGLYLFFKLNVSTAETLMFYSDNMFAEFDVAIMILALLVFLFAVGRHTLRALGRLNELVVPLVVIGVAMLFAIVLLTGFDAPNILPAAREPERIGDALLKHAAWVGDFIPLALFVGRTDLKKSTVPISAVSGVVGSAVPVFFAIVMCAAFGNIPTYADSSTNLTNILQFSYGNIYGRIDMFSSFLWSIASLVETALFFYCTCRCVSYVIGKDRHVAISVCLCAAMYFVQVFAMTDPTVFTAVVSSVYVSAVSVVFTLAVPIIAIVGAVVNNKREKKNGENNGNNDGELTDRTVGENEKV